jgi:hypothetical protein
MAESSISAMRIFRPGLFFRRHLGAGLDAFLVERGDDALAGLQAVQHFAVFPVGQPGLDRPFLQLAAIGVEDQHLAAFLDGSGRDTQYLVAAGQDDFDVGAVADQQLARSVGRPGRLVEIDLDINRARLLFDRRNIGRDAPHLAGQDLPGQGVERDAHRLADLDLRGIDLVHRRLDVEAGIVDQVDGWRRRHAGRRGRRIFAQFADDFRHRAVERRVERDAALLGTGRPEFRFGLRDVGLGRGAGGAADVGLGAGGFFLAGRDEALGAQLALPVGLLFGIDRRNAGFVAAFRAQRDLRPGQRGIGLLVVVPQLEQQLALLDLVAFLDAEVLDAAADDRRQLGPLAGLDGAGPGIGQRRLDLAGGHRLDDHRQRFGARKPIQGQAEQGDDGDNDGDAAHGSFLSKTR